MSEMNYVVSGLSFGDEGKGSFIDFITHTKSLDCLVRYNGGSQASHTVITPSDELHKFSQLGSGMFRKGSWTYLTSNMVINVFNLVEEAKQFSSITHIPVQSILRRVVIDQECWVVTPFHKILNKLRELSLGENRRGSVGTGVSEVPVLRELGMGVQMKDLYGSKVAFREKLITLFLYTLRFLLENETVVLKDVPEGLLIVDLLREIEYISSINSVHSVFMLFNNLTAEYKFNVIEDADSIKIPQAVYEGSQGILLDRKLGISPNTTNLDTSSRFAIEMLWDLGSKFTTIGVLKAFYSRHGKGVFPTEDTELSNHIVDDNQTSSFWNGSLRVGWFDAVLAKYALRVNPVDNIWLSSLDMLSSFQRIKVCTAYMYNGLIDQEFFNTFDYYLQDSYHSNLYTPCLAFDKADIRSVRITDIKRNSNKLSYYLKSCTPVYSERTGWEQDIRNCKNHELLPFFCIEYIQFIEHLLGTKISCVSVGPTRENKLWFQSPK